MITRKDQELVDGEEVQALVKMNILDMIEKPKQFIIDYLAMHTLGSENIGTFFLDQFEMELVGMLKQELLFEVKGIARVIKTTKKGKESKKK